MVKRNALAVIGPGKIHQRLARRLQKTLQASQALRGVGRVVVGLSGGVDSTVLLHQMASIHAQGGPEIVAGHVHHGIRGEEADRDAHVAEKTSRMHDCEFHIVHVGQRLGSERAEHILRRARLDALEALAQSVGASRVLLAHHREDQAETVLLRLLQGADARGLAGIRVVRPPLWVHPFLETSRKEILEEAHGCSLVFVHDSSNDCLDMRRNFLRHRVMPLLKTHFNPRLVDHLCDLARSMGNTYEVMEAHARDLLTRACDTSGAYDARILQEASPAVRDTAIQMAYRAVAGQDKALRRPHVAAVVKLLSLAEGPKTLALPGDVVVLQHSGCIRWVRNLCASSCPCGIV